jgi:hypothetical protein
MRVREVAAAVEAEGVHEPGRLARALFQSGGGALRRGPDGLLEPSVGTVVSTEGSEGREIQARLLTSVGDVPTAMLIGPDADGRVSAQEAQEAATALKLEVVLFAPSGLMISGETGDGTFQAQALTDTAEPGTWSLLRRPAQIGSVGEYVETSGLTVLPIRAPLPQYSPEPLPQFSESARAGMSRGEPSSVQPVRRTVDSNIAPRRVGEDRYRAGPGNLNRLLQDHYDAHLSGWESSFRDVAAGQLLSRVLRVRALYARGRLLHPAFPPMARAAVEVEVARGAVDRWVTSSGRGTDATSTSTYLDILTAPALTPAEVATMIGKGFPPGTGRQLLRVLIGMTENLQLRPRPDSLARLAAAFGGNAVGLDWREQVRAVFAGDPAQDLIRFLLGDPVLLAESVSDNFAWFLYEQMAALEGIIDPKYAEWNVDRLSLVAARWGVVSRAVVVFGLKPPRKSWAAAVVGMVDLGSGPEEVVFDPDLGLRVPLAEWLGTLGVDGETVWWDLPPELSRWRALDVIRELRENAQGSGSLVFTYPVMAVDALPVSSQGRPDLFDLEALELKIGRSVRLGAAADLQQPHANYAISLEAAGQRAGSAAESDAGEGPSA